MENNWKLKSIETLEKDFWGPTPKESTTLVDAIHRLRTIQIEKLEPKDIRLLLSQKIGIKFLIPIALDILSTDLFIDTGFFHGDLLQAVIRVDRDFWNKNDDLKTRFDKILCAFTDEDKEKFRNGKFEEWI